MFANQTQTPLKIANLKFHPTLNNNSLRMNKITLLFFGAFFFGSLTASGQDTIKVMQYNLLNYGYYTSYCTYQNNSAEQKDIYLKQVIDYVLPDIFTVCELGSLNSNTTRILNNVLNTSGRNYYQHAGYTNQAGSSLVNMLYFDSRMFGLKWQGIANSTLRDINVYTLYYKSDDLAFNPDTAFITCVVAHLKAGSSASDQQLRSTMVQNTLNYLKTKNIPNMLFMGDFNIQTSTEWSYQMLVNNTTPSVRFNDPIQMSGVWSGNPDMAPYHTQSTRAQSNDCMAGGGMDDRFDFILVSNAVLDGTDNVQYLNGSYHALGQDGERFNQSINSPVNNTAPANVINALFNMSDHLPVILDLEFDRNPLVIDLQYSDLPLQLKIINPFSNSIEVFFQNPFYSSNLLVEVFDLKGFKCASAEYNSFSGSNIELDASLLPKGIYLLCIYSNGKRLWAEKLLKH